MPSSLRFVLAMLALAALATPFAIYGTYAGDDAQARINAEVMTRGSADAGKVAIARYGCGACHEITGISGAVGQVGPSLKGIASRTEIAGRLANQPDSMIAWLRHPQEIVPRNGMPDLGIGDRDARDISAYLYTLRTTS